jgi:hypothetical protein
MTHEQDLKAFCDQELSAERYAEIEFAAKGDPALARQIDEMKSIALILREELRQPAATGFESTLRALEQPRPASRWWKRWTLAGLGIAALLGMIVVPRLLQTPEFSRVAGVTESAPLSQLDAQFESKSPVADSMEEAVPSRGRSLSVQSESLSDQAKAVKVPRSYQQPLLVRRGSLSLEVDTVEMTQRSIANVAQSFGGFVADRQFSRTEKSRAQGSMTIRVPQQHFDQTIEEITQLGVVLANTSTSEDVTTQVADVEARLKVMRSQELQTIEVLKSARRVGEILAVREQLNMVRQEIESLDAQRKSLRNQANYSTLDIQLAERVQAGKSDRQSNWIENTWAVAINSLAAFGRVLAEFAIYIIVFSPIWLPIAWVIRKLWIRT